MVTHYVGAQEIGRTLGLFPKLDYFALFRQPLGLGENIKNLEKWEKERRERGFPVTARIDAHSIEDLAAGLVNHASTGEQLCLAQNQNTGFEKSVVVIDDAGKENYLKLEEIEKYGRLRGRVIATIAKGEKICKTYQGEHMDGETSFTVRPYSHIPPDFFSYGEGVMVSAWQQNHPAWRWSISFDYFLARDLKLVEQKDLARGIEERLKSRYDYQESPVKLIKKQTYSDIFEVVKKK